MCATHKIDPFLDRIYRPSHAGDEQDRAEVLEHIGVHSDVDVCVFYQVIPNREVSGRESSRMQTRPPGTPARRHLPHRSSR